jgi:hypothetical protein
LDYPVLDAESQELLLVAWEACVTAHLRIDDLEAAAEVEAIIAKLDKLLMLAGNA